MNQIPFFERSQALKEKIELDQAVLAKIRECFSGEIEPFGVGTEHEVYRIGLVENVYLALRKKRFPSFDTEMDVGGMEIYCQNAETLSESRRSGLFLHRPISVGFCIGIEVAEELGILTEDFSENGKYNMTSCMADTYATRKTDDKIVDEVLVDLDGCRPEHYFDNSEKISDTPYFERKNMIILN